MNRFLSKKLTIIYQQMLDQNESNYNQQRNSLWKKSQKEKQPFPLPSESVSISKHTNKEVQAVKINYSHGRETDANLNSLQISNQSFQKQLQFFCSQIASLLNYELEQISKNKKNYDHVNALLSQIKQVKQRFREKILNPINAEKDPNRKKKHTRLTPEEQEILKEYIRSHKKESLQSVANKFGVSQGTAKNYKRLAMQRKD